jgi:hypothetical protein
VRVLVRRQGDVDAIRLSRVASMDLCHELKEFDDALRYLKDDLEMARQASRALGGNFGEGPLSAEEEMRIRTAMAQLAGSVDAARIRIGCTGGGYSAEVTLTGLPQG